jgi:hypothetical protein
MKRIYVTYNQHITGGKALTSEPYSNREPKLIKVDFLLLFRKDPDKFFYDSIEIADESLLTRDYLYLSVVRYSTGDSFGTTSGAWHIIGLSKSYDEAKEMLENALKDPNGYKPWEGYFERLQSYELHKLRLV